METIQHGIVALGATPQPKVPRANRHTLDERERRFIKGVVEGKSGIQAALAAGYARSTAGKKSYAILQRPLVRSALTNALERVGVTLEHIVQPSPMR